VCRRPGRAGARELYDRHRAAGDTHHGAGPKIANMAANILVRNFKVALSDTRFVDISADGHVRRVMGRLGFVEEGARSDVVIYAARDLHPEFPGILDTKVFEIGRDYCRPTAPLCPECDLADLCSFARQGKGVVASGLMVEGGTGGAGVPLHRLRFSAMWRQHGLHLGHGELVLDRMLTIGACGACLERRQQVGGIVLRLG
jgi:hypothetical protein